MIETIRALHQKVYHETPTDFYFSPGQLNILGAHTSVSGGFTLSMSTSVGIYFACRLRNDGIMKIFHNQILEEPLELSVSNQDNAHPFQKIISKLDYEGYTLQQGFNISIYAHLPTHIGLSSRASTVIGLIRILLEINNHPYRPEKLIKFAHQVEQINTVIPTSYAEQMNVVYGKKNHALFISCKDYSYHHVPLELEKYRWYVFSANYKDVALETKLKTRYNEIKEGTKLMFSKRPIDDVCDVEFTDFNRLKHEIKDQNVIKRLEHVIFENDRALQGYKALQKNYDSVLFELINHSQESLTELFEMRIPEVDYLVEKLNVLGSNATRMIFTTKSAGVFAIFNANHTVDFESLRIKYESRFKRNLDIVEVCSSDGFHQLKASNPKD